jgi:hypothetical protein
VDSDAFGSPPMIQLDRADITKERQLLVCCARTQLHQDDIARIRDLVLSGVDWRYLLDEAANHALRPLLYRHLQELGEVPVEAIAELRAVCRANAIRNLFLSAELCKVLDAFRRRGIAAIPYKGPVQAVQAYGDVTLREFDDLDLVLRHRDVPGAHEIMLGLGYAPRFPWIHSQTPESHFIPGEYSYSDDDRRVMVELHTELTLRHFPQPPNLEDFFARLIPVSIGGKEVRTFSPADLLPFLCVHGSKDFWARLAWIADLRALIEDCSGFPWDRSLGVARQLGVERMVLLGVNLAHNVFDLQLPDEIVASADMPPGRLARQFAAQVLERHPRNIGAVERFWIRWQMAGGIARGARYAVRLTTSPTEEDLSDMPSPRRWWALQPMLRPLRLLRKYDSAR